MKLQQINTFIKKELSGWKKEELAGILIVLAIIIYNAVVLKDSAIAITSAVCGILYTVIAGKGKISCYLFGLTGSSFYGYLAFSNALWGNLLLYVGYYIPMQILGIFKWKKNLKKETNEIYKTQLTNKERFILTLISLIGCFIGYIILHNANDTHPLTDSMTTILSITGMYLTVRRCIEQWIIWTLVNALAIIMWFSVLKSGQKVYSTLLMWSVYLILGIYFYFQWRKEIK